MDGSHLSLSSILLGAGLRYIQSLNKTLETIRVPQGNLDASSEHDADEEQADYSFEDFSAPPDIKTLREMIAPVECEFSNAFNVLIKHNTRGINFSESSGSALHSHFNAALFQGSSYKLHDLFVTLLDLRHRYRESIGDEIIAHLLGIFI